MSHLGVKSNILKATFFHKSAGSDTPGSGRSKPKGNLLRSHPQFSNANNISPEWSHVYLTLCLFSTPLPEWMDSYLNTTEGLPEAPQSHFTRTSVKDVFIQTHKSPIQQSLKLTGWHGSWSVLHFDFHGFLSLPGLETFPSHVRTWVPVTLNSAALLSGVVTWIWWELRDRYCVLSLIWGVCFV